MVHGSYPMSLSLCVARKQHYFVFSSDRHGLKVKHIDSERDRQIDSCGVPFIILFTLVIQKKALLESNICSVQEWECVGCATRACEGFRQSEKARWQVNTLSERPEESGMTPGRDSAQFRTS